MYACIPTGVHSPLNTEIPMLNRLSTLISRHPRRSLLTLVLAVLVATVIGGPVAGLLSGGDGPVVSGSDSQRADALVEQATGAGASPGVVALSPWGGVPPGGCAAVAQARRMLQADPTCATSPGRAPAIRSAYRVRWFVGDRHRLCPGDAEETSSEATTAAFKDRKSGARRGHHRGLQIGDQAARTSPSLRCWPSPSWRCSPSCCSAACARPRRWPPLVTILLAPWPCGSSTRSRRRSTLNLMFALGLAWPSTTRCS